MAALCSCRVERHVSTTGVHRNQKMHANASGLWATQPYSNSICSKSLHSSPPSPAICSTDAYKTLTSGSCSGFGISRPSLPVWQRHSRHPRAECPGRTADMARPGLPPHTTAGPGFLTCAGWEGQPQQRVGSFLAQTRLQLLLLVGLRAAT